MEHYVGLDMSLKRTSICVVNHTGSVVREGVVDSDPEAIASFVRSNAPGAVRIGLETGATATWLWNELKRFGLPAICIDARHAKAVLKMQINKSDRNDAAGIARIMQTGTPSCGGHAPTAERTVGPAMIGLENLTSRPGIREQHRHPPDRARPVLDFRSRRICGRALHGAE